MRGLTHIMLCKHKHSKMKLIIHATKSRYGHIQGTAMARCCAKCGKQLYDEEEREDA